MFDRQDLQIFGLYFLRLEVVGRISETQLQVFTNLDSKTQRSMGYDLTVGDTLTWWASLICY